MTALTGKEKTVSFRDISLTPQQIETRRIGLGDLRDCLIKGYRDYSDNPLVSVPFIVLFYGISALLVSAGSFGQDLRYLAFPLVAGLTLIGPIVAIAFFEISRQREEGRKIHWSSAFEFIHTAAFAPILALSILMAALYVFWLYMAELIFFGLFGTTLPDTLGAFVNQLFTTREGVLLIAYGNFVGFLFAFAALAISVVSFPLTLDKPVTSFTAISVSVRAVFSNMGVIMVWGLIVALILAAGTALMLIGLALALPILGHATWHLYRRLVVQG
ncbi:MAG: hypothetical protein RLZZ385_2386 [Pseudomonadota bacterium]|jgi:uncharacterized membrane protein